MKLTKPNEITLSDYIQMIRGELTLAQAKAEAELRKDPAQPFFLLKEVRVDLEVSSKEEIGAEGNAKLFMVVSAGANAKSSSSATQKVSVLLSPAQPVLLGSKRKTRVD